MNTCPILTGALQLPIHPGCRVAAVCILIVAIYDGVGWAAAICWGWQKEPHVGEMQTPGDVARQDPGHHAPLQGRENGAFRSSPDSV